MKLPFLHEFTFRTIIKDIRFWIFLFFAIRLLSITAPPLEHIHNWRQITGISVARNFYEIDCNILYPRVDDNYGKSGIVGMEFPILNYTMCIISKCFGFNDWYGRLLNLIISSLGIWFFYKLISKYFYEKVAFFSSILLLSSIWFMFSRKMMHDTFCISLAFIGIWYGLQYLQLGKLKNIALYFLIMLIAILSKIPAAMFLIIFAFPILNKSIPLKRKIYFFLTSCIIITAIWWWYFVWNIHLSSTYGLWYNIGKSLSQGLHDLQNDILLVLEIFYFDAFKSYVASVMAIIGIWYLVIKKQKIALGIVSLLFFVFALYCIKSGSFFSKQNYYIIPFVPVIAFLGGYGLYFTYLHYKKLSYIILILISCEAFLNQKHDLYPIPDTYKLELESILNSYTNRSDLIITNGNGNPQELYFSHRKGWSVSNTTITNKTYISKIKYKGCKVMLINKHDFKGSLPIELKKEFENNDYIVFRL